MAWELKDGQGTLWQNAVKRSPKSPDYSGDAMLNGRKIRLVGWKKTTQKGGTFISLAAEWADDQRQDEAPDPNDF